MEAFVGRTDNDAFSARAFATLTTRTLGHAGAWSNAWVTGPRRATVLAAISLMGDIGLSRALADKKHVNGALRWFADALDAAAWATILGTDPTLARPVVMATALPAASEAGFLFGAGLRAVPTPPSASAWPPDRDALVPIVRIVASTFASPAAVYIVRRCRGLRGGLGTFGWGAVGAALFVATARSRERQQDRARREWFERAESAVSEERGRSRVWAATREHHGHDFKGVLTALKVNGSEAAGLVLADQMAHPSAVVGSMRGGTVVDRVASGVIVEDGAAVWLSELQARRLSEFLDRTEELDLSGAELKLTVSRPEPGTIRFEYLGRVLDVAAVPPRRDHSIAPVAGGFAYGLVTRILSVRGGLLPVRAAVATTVIDLGALIAFWRYPPEGSATKWLVAASALTTYLSCLAITRSPYPRHNPLGTPVFGPGGTLMSHTMLLSYYRRHLPPVLHVSLCLGTVLAFGACALVRPRLKPLELVDACAGVLMPFGLNWDMEDRFDYEAALLDEQLAREFQQLLLSARRDAELAELARFRYHLEIAERALRTPTVAVNLDDKLFQWIEDQIGQLRRWLEEEGATREHASA